MFSKRILIVLAVVVAIGAAQPVFAQGEEFVTNLGASSVVVEGDWLAYSQWESFRGDDLNGDGDTEDTVAHVHNLATGETTNLGLALPNALDSFLSVSGNWLGVSVNESDQGEDLNGNGDTEDTVAQVHNLATGETTNLGLALPNALNGFLSVSGNWLVVFVIESDLGEDLNGDGDTGDVVVHLVDLSRLLGDQQLPGDCNQDGTVDISDAICIFGVLFLGQPAAFPCGDGAVDHAGNVTLLDWQPDASVDISDGIGALLFLFGGGPPHARGSACMPIAECSSVCP